MFKIIDGKVFSQICPYCESQWHWSNTRRLECYRYGMVNIECSKCHKTFTVNKAGEVIEKQQEDK